MAILMFLWNSLTTPKQHVLGMQEIWIPPGLGEEAWTKKGIGPSLGEVRSLNTFEDLGLGDKTPGFSSWLGHCTQIWGKTLNLAFPIYKMRIIASLWEGLVGWCL